MWYNECSPEDRQLLDSGKCLTINTDYGDMVIRKGFAEGSQRLEFDTSKAIPIDCPVRLAQDLDEETQDFELYEVTQSSTS